MNMCDKTLTVTITLDGVSHLSYHLITDIFCSIFNSYNTTCVVCREVMDRNAYSYAYSIAV